MRGTLEVLVPPNLPSGLRSPPSPLGGGARVKGGAAGPLQENGQGPALSPVERLRSLGGAGVGWRARDDMRCNCWLRPPTPPRPHGANCNSEESPWEGDPARISFSRGAPLRGKEGGRGRARSGPAPGASVHKCKCFSGPGPGCWSGPHGRPGGPAAGAVAPAAAGPAPAGGRGGRGVRAGVLGALPRGQELRQGVLHGGLRMGPRCAPRTPRSQPPPVSDRAAGLTAAGPTGAGDCETWELKRMFVMGPFYRDVQSVEYQVRSGRRAATAGRAGLTVRTTRRRSTRRGRSGT